SRYYGRRGAAVSAGLSGFHSTLGLGHGLGRLKVQSEAANGVLGDLQYGELDAVATERGADFGHAPEGVEGEAADGLVVLVGRQAQAEAIVELLEVERGVDLVEVVAQGLDLFGFGPLVVLVLDRADELLDEILQRDEPRHGAELVEDDGDLHVPRAELLE